MGKSKTKATSTIKRAVPVLAGGCVMASFLMFSGTNKVENASGRSLDIQEPFNSPEEEESERELSHNTFPCSVKFDGKEFKEEDYEDPVSGDKSKVCEDFSLNYVCVPDAVDIFADDILDKTVTGLCVEPSSHSMWLNKTVAFGNVECKEGYSEDRWAGLGDELTYCYEVFNFHPNLYLCDVQVTDSLNEYYETYGYREEEKRLRRLGDKVADYDCIKPGKSVMMPANVALVCDEAEFDEDGTVRTAASAIAEFWDQNPDSKDDANLITSIASATANDDAAHHFDDCIRKPKLPGFKKLPYVCAAGVPAPWCEPTDGSGKGGSGKGGSGKGGSGKGGSQAGDPARKLSITARDSTRRHYRRN